MERRERIKKFLKDPGVWLWAFYAALAALIAACVCVLVLWNGENPVAYALYALSAALFGYCVYASVAPVKRLAAKAVKSNRLTARMARVVGRTDDMLIIRGVNVFPSQIESVLMAMPELGKTYEIIVDRVNYMDTIEVRVEVGDASLLTDYSKLEELVAKIKHKLRVVVQLDVKVKLVEPFSIKRAEGKVKRVTDLRKN